jgi:hypothetical protein
LPGYQCRAHARQQYIQEDFVKQRQEDQSITMDDLIHQMTISRYFSSLWV